MKIGVSEQRLVLGEGSTARRMPWLRLRLAVLVGLISAVGCVLSENAFAKAADLSPTISVRVYNYVKASPRCLPGSNAKLAESSAKSACGRSG
jgi:hypothetical protein